MLRHHKNGKGIEVVAEIKANGSRLQRTGYSNGNGALGLAAQLEIASDDEFRSCASAVLELTTGKTT